jgi:hypothetical protein
VAKNAKAQTKKKDEEEAGAAMAAEVKRQLLDMCEVVAGPLANMEEIEVISDFLRGEVKKRLINIANWEKHGNNI